MLRSGPSFTLFPYLLPFSHTFYPFPIPIYLLTHFSHDRVIVSHAYLSSDLLLSQPCTSSHDYSILTRGNPYLSNVYIDLGIRCTTQLSLTQIYLSTWSSPHFEPFDISIPLRYTFVIVLTVSSRDIVKVPHRHKSSEPL